MVNKKVTDRGAVDTALQAAGNVATKPIEPEEKPKARPTAINLNAKEYEYLKGVFYDKGHGLPISTGIKLAALWLAEQVEAGAMSISKAGVIDRRGKQ